MIKGRVDDREALDLLKRLQRKSGNLREEMNLIGAIGRRSMLKNFEVGGRYSEPGSWRGGSRRWEPLKASTLLGRNSRFVRSKKGGGEFRLSPKPRLGILQVTLKLRNSIQYHGSDNSVSWGSNRPEAAAHNYGAKTRPHTITARHKKALAWPGGANPVRSVKHPGSKIPARPFVVLQDEDMRAIKELLQARLSNP